MPIEKCGVHLIWDAFGLQKMRSKEEFLLVCMVIVQVVSNPSQRNPLAPSDWGDDSPQGDEPLSREELLKSYLFSQNKNGDIHVEDFLWTGSGDSELPLEDFDITSSIVDGVNSNNDDSNFINYLPTTLTVTRVSTVVSTIHHNPDSDPGGQPVNTLDQIDPTPTWPMASNTYASHVGFQNVTSRSKLPNEKYLVRTVVLSNMTVIRRDIEKFKKDMEIKLERAFRKAYARKRKRMKRDEGEGGFRLPRRVRRQAERTTSYQRPVVKIHNIRSSLPEPEIEMLYTVYEDNQPVLAETAVETLLDNVDDEDAEEYLGFPLITKAEPYIQRLKAGPHSSSHQGTSTWMITSVILCTLFLLALLLLILLLTWNRCSDEREHPAKHRRLVSSPIPQSSQALKDRRRSSLKQSSSSSLDKAGFILDRAKSSIVRVSDPEYDFEEATTKSPSPKAASPQSMSKQQQLETATIEKHPTRSDCATSTGSLNAITTKVDRAESPISGGEPTPVASVNKAARQRRAKALLKKNKVGKRPSERNSAFPSSTPDRSGWLGPLSDLLEEEDGDDGEMSLPPHSPGRHSNSSHVSSSSTTSTTSSPSLRVGWRKGNARGKGSNSKTPEDQKDRGEDEPEEPTRAISAKSHLFRKGKVESRLSNLGKFNRTRPWSASDTRPPPPAGDPTFYMRQRHWEGLIAGKKHLHRGQLLPGSTSSEDDEGTYSKINPPATCWSEGSSPRKQVRIQEEPMEIISQEVDKSGQLIQAIKEELQRFQRPKSPNLTGISVINDPELVQRDPSS